MPDLDAVLVPQRRDVAKNQPDALAVSLDKDRASGTPAEGLETQRAGAGEQVDDRAIDDQSPRMLNNDSRTRSLVGRVLADARGPSILWPRLCPAIIRI